MAFSESFDKQLRPVLNAVDAVARILGADADISLPRTVVVGDQSSGKSSLLESIFGFALPRGEDIVTRTPIQVEHRNVASGTAAWAELEYTPAGASDSTTERIVLDQIPDKVAQATNQVAGINKGIVNSTIFLKVFSSKLPDLTITDLPGIARVAVGDQPADIEAQTTALIEAHVKGALTVNLCVVPVGTDFATAAAINIARAHDPAGARSMGVVTKADLSERGVDLLGRLRKGEEMLKLGFIPVRNRTAEELKNNASLDAVRAAEARFFDSHADLSQLDAGRRGVDALVQQLVRVQADCIRTSFPKLKAQIQKELRLSEKELVELTGKCVATEGEAHHRASQLLAQVTATFGRLVEGDYSMDLLAGLSADEAERVKVPKLFNGKCMSFKDKIDEACRPSYFLGDEFKAYLVEAVADYQGVSLPNFLSNSVFVRMYSKFVFANLGEPSHELADATRELVEEALRVVTRATLGEAFPRLEAYSQAKIWDLVGAQAGELKKYMETVISSQEMVMTLNHYYTDTLAKVRETCTQWRAVHQQRGEHNVVDAAALKEAQASTVAEGGEDMWNFIEKMADSKDQAEVGLMEMQISLMAYSKVVLKLMYDMVPKGVRMLLINRVVSGLHVALLSGGDGGYLGMMSDDALRRQLAAKRDRVAKLREAEKTLQGVAFA